MQTINLHIYKQTIVPVLFAKQGDVGRKFKAVLTDGTAGYTIPADTVFSVWFSGASGEGNYSAIDGRSAFAISGNTVEVELITQMLNNKGQGVLCLVMNNTDGTQIGTWNIPYEVEAVPGMGSAAAQQHFTALSEVAAAAAASAARAEAAAKKLTIDDTLSKTGQAADANAVGEKVTAIEGRITTTETEITAIEERITTTETEITAINGRVTDVETEIENLKSGIEPTLLWSNQDPVAIFAAQEGFAPSQMIPLLMASAFTAVCAIAL